MIIKNGYWNYYIAFRIENYASHLKEVSQKTTFSGIPAFITNGTLMESKETFELLEKRKSVMQDCKSALGDTVSTSTLHEMYDSNQLPEFFWDFDESLNDLLEQAIKDSIGHAKSFDNSYMEMFGAYGNNKCQYYVLMPLKVYFSEDDFVFCRVFIQLFTSGNGMIKLELPLKNISTDFFCHHPVRRWYSHIKAWGALLPGFSEDAYKIIQPNSDYEDCIMDIFGVLSSYVQKFFSESIIDKDRFLGFETFVISDSIDCNILEINQENIIGLKQLYHFARPDDFAINPSCKELQQFWNDSHFNASGIHVIKGSSDRLILYAPIDEFKRTHGGVSVADYNEYLQASITQTYDPFILLALAQKDNDMTIYSLSQKNSHSIRHNMTHYYANANYFDSILILAPIHGKKFYNEILSVLDQSLVDFPKMLGRMQQIEEYEKTNASERRNRLLYAITLIFTAFFGLPFIYDTLTILKRSFHNIASGISSYTISKISFIIWLALLFFIVSNFANNFLEYQGCGISSRIPFVSQAKSLIRAIRLIFKGMFKKH